MLNNGCVSELKKGEIVQLTDSRRGHMLHHNGVFSKNNQWIVFDTRNDETKIGETSEIGIVNPFTGEEKIIYHTYKPTKYGPGVGAASFSPKEDRVIFIHGLSTANKEKPYGFTRRTGVAIDINKPFEGIFMDARDITFPFTSGSLRGGTHSHCWSPDGKLISFTYNDEFVDPDLRVVGVMFDAGYCIFPDSIEGNNKGELYASIVTDVTSNPRTGSDEINKAFDECWVGNNGYINQEGNEILYAVAFQGNTKNESGEIITEIFVVDVDTSSMLKDTNSVGQLGERPKVPEGIQQRRISRTEKGLSSVRHWLRSSKDGLFIYALAEDNKGVVQLIKCHINTGEIDYLTHNSFSVTNPFNVSTDGSKIAFIGENNVYLLDLDTNSLRQITNNKGGEDIIVGAPVFSRDDNILVFNQYTLDKKEDSFIQIKAVYLGSKG